MNEHEKYLLWLRELKPGDQFAYPASSFVGATAVIYTVARVTPSQIVCEPHYKDRPDLIDRFNRSTGRRVGGNAYRTIQPVTDKIRDAVELVALKAWLFRVERTGAPLYVLRAMKAAFDEAIKK